MAKKAKKKTGRSTKYKPEYAKIAGELCREKGYTDKNLAVYFKVSEATIYNWKREFLEFLESIKKGKDEFDSREVEQALLKRAKGYTYVETTRELQGDDEEIIDEESEISIQTLVVTKKVHKHIAADVKAQIFWLKNRQPQRWSDMMGQIISGEIKLTPTLSVEEIKDRLKDLDDAGNGLATG